MTNNTAFTIVSINHPDDLRTPETRYAVNSYTHRHRGRRPRQIALKKQLAIPWTKSSGSTPGEAGACNDRASSETERSECPPQLRNTTKLGVSMENSSPLTIEFSGLRRDPFTSYPIAVQGCVEGAVDFWLKEWVPSQVTAFLHNQALVTDAVISTMFELALSNAETFQSLVAMSQAIRESLLQHDAYKCTSPQILHHKGIALHTLQQRFDNISSVDETTMLTVLNLMTLELFQSESISFRLHLSALRQMSTQPSIFQTELRKQVFLGYLDASHVFLKALEYQQHRCSEDCGTTGIHFAAWRPVPLELSVFLPSGFRALADEGQLSLDLARVILRLSAWIDLVNDCGKLKDIGMVMELRPWVDIENILVCLEAERFVSPPTTEKVVSLSLFCLCCYILRRFSSSGIFYRMLAELMDSIEQYAPRGETQAHVQVWATVLVAGIAHEKTHLTSRSGRLVDFIIKGLPKPLVVADLEIILRRFFSFYRSTVAWIKHWSAGLERKRQRVSP